jgi:hypothetical protein
MPVLPALVGSATTRSRASWKIRSTTWSWEGQRSISERPRATSGAAHVHGGLFAKLKLLESTREKLATADLDREQGG